jgi:hypothetical protein
MSTQVAGTHQSHSGGSFLILQAQMKRDPAAYAEDFVIQVKHLDSQLKIWQLKPDASNTNQALFKPLQEQIQFICQV